MPSPRHPEASDEGRSPRCRANLSHRCARDGPSIQFWRRSGGTSTSERGFETNEPHFRGIFDEKGRLMVIMTHNTDIADGWEREAEDDESFYRFSIRAYPLGVNIAIYAMTH